MSAPAITPREVKPIVIYVLVGQKRLVVPIRDPTGRVFELAALIAARFRIERVAELRTGGGFLLDVNDIISEVLRDGQVVECLDYTMWIEENNGEINKNNRSPVWAELEQADFLDDKLKWVRAGYAPSINKFFIRMGGEKANFPMQLDLFEPIDLMSIAKKGPHVISQIGDSKLGWHASAELVAGENGVVDTVRLRCKSRSDEREAIKVLKITVNPSADKQVVCGDITLIQSSELPSEDVKYEIPGPLVDGPSYGEIPEEDKSAAKAAPVSFPEIKGEGSLPMFMTLKMKPELDRGYQRNPSTPYDFSVSTELELLNRGDSSLVITKTTAEYKKENGDWEAVKLNRGRRNGPWNYSWDPASKANDSFTVYAKNPSKMAFGVTFPINMPQLSRARAIPSTLPNPLEIRFSVFDVNGGQCSVIIPLKTSAAELDLVTKDKHVKSNGEKNKKCIGYVQCDDTKLEGRVAASIFLHRRENYEDEYIIRQTLGNSYHTYSETALKRTGFKAAAEGKTEVELKDSGAKNDVGSSFTVTALVDVPRRRVYALKLDVSTTTSRVVETFPVKVDPSIFAA